MAIFRNIQMSFWTDPKIADDFTPEDRYFYLYLMTNPHTNLCGCYEISIKQMADETGYNKASIEKLVTRLETVHRVITYSHDTKELLLVNWSKYNWTASEKFRKPLLNEIQSVKNPTIKAFLMDLFNGNDSVLIPYPYGSDTTDTVTDTITVTVSDTDNKVKHIYGEYKNVRLTDVERNKLMDEYGEAETSKAIKYLDEYIEMKGYKAKSHYLAIRKWVFDAVNRENERSGTKKQTLAEKWLNA
jgi:hypothetical protein